MSKTVSFVARDELAEWLELRAERQMKSISAVCQDIVAAEYRRQRKRDIQAKVDKAQQTEDKAEQTGDRDDTPDPLDEIREFSFASKQQADAVRTEFSEHLDYDDDKRMTDVHFAEGTPGEVVKELERRSED